MKYLIILVLFYLSSVQCLLVHKYKVLLELCPIEDAPVSAVNNNDTLQHTKPLVSFEEWQKRILQNDEKKHHKRKSSSSDEKKQMVDSIDGGFSDDFGSMLEGFMGGSKKTPNVYTEGEYISPTHGSTKKDVRSKSLKERFNYASIDCAATVRKVNKQAKGAQSILYESKDQYLLNKCAADKFVIINLCEQIVVDTIVMANFEFFSSTFKDFKVYASSKYPTEDWKLLGQWQARNTRDLQVFRVPDSGFVEYLKIEFLTHYGREYYCPLSLVRVHGMTMMEYYTIVESQDQDPKVEHLWPAEVREQIIQPQFDVTNISESFPIKVESEEEEENSEPTISPVDPPHIDMPDIKLDLSKEYTKEEEPVIDIETTTVPSSSAVEIVDETTESILENNESSSQEEPSSSFVSSSSSTSSDESTHSTTTRLDSSNNDTTLVPDDTETSTTTTTTIAIPTTQPVPPPKPHPKEGSSSTQESIYKTIMKRLHVLEHDVALSQRFLDDQNKILNDVFLDMEKKHQEQLIMLIGHLNETASQKIDTMQRRYEQWYVDLKEQNEHDMREMTAKMSILADQLSFERRVSVSQLVIMITIFVFMALSRGTFSALSPVMAAQLQERQKKRRAPIDTETKQQQQQQPDAVVPQKPKNPRRHSDSPYHIMGEIDLNSPTPKKLSRNSSRESLLQNELFQKKLDELLLEQQQQQQEVQPPLLKARHSSLENLKNQ